MSALSGSSAISEAGSPDPTECLRYVARQPIMDMQGHVHGYELLFRSGPEAIFRGDGDLATRTMLDNTVLFGLERLTGGLPAFFNCTRESLTQGLVDVLPTSMAVLEILETIEPTEDLVASCRKLKEAGFRLALDDFVWRPEFRPLVEIADYIKVDFLATRAAARRELLAMIDRFHGALIAEKVETQEDFKLACEEGFSLFQGYYFCRPTLLKSNRIPSNRLSQIAILQLLHSVNIDLHELANRVKQDASLTYRLLRLVNSPLYRIRQEIRSIDTALLVVGEDAFRRIALLAITSELSASQPLELLRMAFIRGRFCESGARRLALDPTEQYLLGLLSLIPAMLRTPMRALTPSLPFRQEVRNALEGELNLERSLLQWIERHENGDWQACDQLAATFGLEREILLGNYSEAVTWTEEVLTAVL